MRTVLKNSNEVIHLWAHQTQEDGRCGNVRFHGKLLYSYSTIIAQIEKDLKGSVWAFLSSKSLTPTTGKHVNTSVRATNHLEQIFTPAFAAYWSHYGRTIEEMLMPIYVQLQTDFLKLSRMRNHLPWGIEFYEEKKTKLYKTIDLFGITSIPLDLPEASGDLKEKAREIIANNAEKKRIVEIEREKKRELQKIEDQENFHRWLTGENIYFPTSFRERGNDYITIHNGEILTSQSASAPISDTVKALRFYDSRKNENGDYNPFQSNDHIIRLGNFKLDSIDEQGKAKAGCHMFKAEEIARFRNLWKEILGE